MNNIKPSKLPKKSIVDILSFDSSQIQTLDEFLDFNSSKEVLVFDTNFLFVPFEFRVEVISEIQKVLGKSVAFVIVKETIDELYNIEKKGDKNKKFLPLIATFLKKYNIKVITNVLSEEITHVDDILCALPNNFAIATNDKLLKQRLWKIPKRVVFMRQMSYLDLK